MITKKGEVISFDRGTAFGQLQFADQTTMIFSSTSFQSGRPIMYPKVGDKVCAIFTEDGQFLCA